MCIHIYIYTYRERERYYYIYIYIYNIIGQAASWCTWPRRPCRSPSPSQKQAFDVGPDLCSLCVCVLLVPLAGRFLSLAVRASPSITEQRSIPEHCVAAEQHRALRSTACCQLSEVPEVRSIVQIVQVRAREFAYLSPTRVGMRLLSGSPRVRLPTCRDEQTHRLSNSRSAGRAKSHCIYISIVLYIHMHIYIYI